MNFWQTLINLKVTVLLKNGIKINIKKILYNTVRPDDN